MASNPVINKDEDFHRHGRRVTNIAYAYDVNLNVQTETITCLNLAPTGTENATENWVKTYTWSGGVCTNETGFVKQ